MSPECQKIGALGSGIAKIDCRVLELESGSGQFCVRLRERKRIFDPKLLSSLRREALEVFAGKLSGEGQVAGELLTDVRIAGHTASALARAGGAYNQEGTEPTSRRK
jgi:hypothetical protein